MATPRSVEERRRHPRVSLEVDVDLSTEHNFYTAKTRDMSMGGLFVSTSIGLAHGTPITVKLALGKKTLELTTRVAWVLNGADGGIVGFGVEFEKLSADASRAIETFMKKRDPLQFGLTSEVDGELEETTSDVAKPPPLPPKG